MPSDFSIGIINSFSNFLFIYKECRARARSHFGIYCHIIHHCCCSTSALRCWKIYKYETKISADSVSFEYNIPPLRLLVHLQWICLCRVSPAFSAQGRSPHDTRPSHSMDCLHARSGYKWIIINSTPHPQNTSNIGTPVRFSLVKLAWRCPYFTSNFSTHLQNTSNIGTPVRFLRVKLAWRRPYFTSNFSTHPQNTSNMGTPVLFSLVKLAWRRPYFTSNFSTHPQNTSNIMSTPVRRSWP